MRKGDSKIKSEAVQRAVLIYDGECSLCRSAKDWIEKSAITGQVEFLPCQSEDRKRRFPDIKEEICLQAMHVILPDGRILSGDEGFRDVLRYTRRWKWLAYLFRVPGIRFLSPRIYAWVSRNRHGFKKR